MGVVLDGIGVCGLCVCPVSLSKRGVALGLADIEWVQPTASRALVEAALSLSVANGESLGEWSPMVGPGRVGWDKARPMLVFV